MFPYKKWVLSVTSEMGIKFCSFSQPFISAITQKLITISYSTTKNKEDAEDIVQNIFAEVIEKNTEFKDEQHAECYLKKMTHDRSINFVKKQQNTVYIEDISSYDKFNCNCNNNKAENINSEANKAKIKIAAEILCKLSYLKRDLYKYRKIKMFSFSKIRLLINKHYCKNYTVNALECKFRIVEKFINNQKNNP